MADEKKERVALTDEEVDKVAGGMLALGGKFIRKCVCDNPDCDAVRFEWNIFSRWNGKQCPKCRKGTLKYDVSAS